MFFSSNIQLTILGLLPLHITFTINLLVTTKQLAEIFSGIELNLQMKLRTGILTILTLSIHAHGIFLHLFTSSFDAFHHICVAFLYRFYKYFVRFLQKYFILGSANTISNSTCSLLIYRKAVDFYILTFRPTTLLYS